MIMMMILNIMMIFKTDDYFDVYVNNNADVKGRGLSIMHCLKLNSTSQDRFWMCVGCLNNFEF